MSSQIVDVSLPRSCTCPGSSPLPERRRGRWIGASAGRWTVSWAR